MATGLTLETERLLLAPLVPADRPDFCRILRNPLVSARLELDACAGDDALLSTMFEARRRARIAGRPARLAIHLRMPPRFVGLIGVHRARGRRLGLSYWLDAAYHGRGLGGEALAAFCAAVPAAYGATTLLAEVLPDNAASVAVLRRTGFRPVAARRGTRLLFELNLPAAP